MNADCQVRLKKSDDQENILLLSITFLSHMLPFTFSFEDCMPSDFIFARFFLQFDIEIFCEVQKSISQFKCPRFSFSKTG